MFNLSGEQHAKRDESKRHSLSNGLLVSTVGGGASPGGT